MNQTILYQGINFWRIEGSGQLSVTTFSGKGDDGSLGGRSYTKAFTSPSDATKWVTDMIEKKRSSGFQERPKVSPDKTELRRSSRKRNPSAQDTQSSTQGSPTKKVKRGLKGQSPVETSTPLGVVDPTSGLDGGIYSTIIGDDVKVYDAMLVLVDIQTNTDKFIVLQIIKVGKWPSLKYVVYERWGRTGTSGQSLSQEYDSSHLGDAIKKFNDVILKKTGLSFDAATTSAPIQGKYIFVQQDFRQKERMIRAMLIKPNSGSKSTRKGKRAQPTPGQPLTKWQYWVDDGVDGKVTGWYDYDANGNFLVEQLYYEFLNNACLNSRIVKSGDYSYLVQLDRMTQTNVVHPNQKIRQIRRTENGIEVRYDASLTNSADNHGTESKEECEIEKEQEQEREGTEEEAIQVNTVKTEIVSTKIKVKDEVEIQHQKEENTPVIEIPVDENCPRADTFQVVSDRDITMNQTNITNDNNNNKYYKMQILTDASEKFFVWTRWGRVGEIKQSQMKLMGPFADIGKAEKTFDKKFREKSGFKWSDRHDHEGIQGKYQPLKIDYTDDKKTEAKLESETPVEYQESKLEGNTKDLVGLLFEENMYLDALKEFDIDVKKMPLGKLTESQILKGIEVLKKIETKLQRKNVKKSELQELSSNFYTVLPHDFGRRRPPVIDEDERLKKCFGMCNTLLDMQKATEMMDEASDERKEEGKPDNLHVAKIDKQYSLLKSEMRLLEEESDEFKLVSQGFELTKADNSFGRRFDLLNIWRVERDGECSRFNGMSSLPNHQLLFHGTHIGSVAAILATGLRIMEHSGGRVGKGIYLASESDKSLGYTRPALNKGKRIGCMFMVQAALGKSFEIEEDDYSLVSPPQGYDSVKACGRTSPETYKSLELDGVEVKVPASKPKTQNKRSNSRFGQDELLVYNENQARLRYIITISF